MKDDESGSHVGDSQYDPPAAAPLATASANERVSSILRELDSYRRVSRDAFEEGFSFGRLDCSLSRAWDGSEARKAEWSFADMRIVVGHMMRRLLALRQALRQIDHDENDLGEFARRVTAVLAEDAKTWERPPALDASDPHAGDTGKLTTRAEPSSSSEPA